MDLVATSSPTVIGPRERAQSEGVSSLGDADLLAVLLGTGLAGRPVGLVAAGLIERFGSLHNLARLGPTALAEHPGVGLAKALRLAAAMEIGARAARPPATLARLSNSIEVAEFMAPRLAGLVHEEMWLLCLDGQNRVRGLRRVAQGGLHGLSIDPRDVLRAALHEAASSAILVHNHPGGDPAPSPEDLTTTRRLGEAARVVGVPLVDHVIIASADRYCSLLDLGVLPIE